MTKEQATFGSIICLTISAVAWFLSALITPIVTKTYWDAPPKNLVTRLRIGSWLNASAAIFAAAGVALQAYASAQ